MVANGYGMSYDRRRCATSASTSPWRSSPTRVDARAFRFARLRYTKTRKEWALYWRDRNLKFHLYDLAAAHAQRRGAPR